MRHLWIWGAGELGGRVGVLWQNLGGEVTALTKTETRHEALSQQKLNPRVGDPKGIGEDDVLLISIAGTAALDRAVALIEKTRPPHRVVITSSTGYFGTQGGALSAESPPGETERAQEIAAMESRFTAWAGSQGTVIRLGGLYRQGRGPLNVMRKRGSAPLGVPPDRVIPLVHYDDAAAACFAALRVERPRPTYLVVSPPCPTRQDFYLAACVILDVPLPSFEQATGRPRAEYDIGHTIDDLDYAPQYPRWQAALIP